MRESNSATEGLILSCYWEAEAETLVFDSTSGNAIAHSLGRSSNGSVSWGEIVDAEDRSIVLETLRAAAKDRKPFAFDTRMTNGSSGWIWVRVVGDSKDTGVLRGFMADCTGHIARNAEAEARHRELFEGVPSPVICYDWHSRRIVDVNVAAVAHYGYSKEEFLNMTIERLWPPEMSVASEQKMGRMNPIDPVRLEWIHVRKDGQRIAVDIAAHSILYAGQQARVVIVNDITERKIIERELLLSNERLTLLTRVTGTVVGSLPLSEQAQFMADQVRQAFQVDACVIRLLRSSGLELLAGAGIENDLLPSVIPAVSGFAERVMTSKCPISIDDAREIDDPVASGVPYLTQYRFISYAAAPLMVKEQIIGVIALYTDKEIRKFSDVDLAHLQIVAGNVAVSVHNDELYNQVNVQKNALETQIGERIRAEDALRQNSESLRESEERLRLVTEASTDGIWEWDRATDTLTWSDRVYSLLGLDQSTRSAHMVQALEIVHPDDRHAYKAAIIRHLRKGGPYQLQLRLKRGDGSYGLYEAFGQLAKDKNGRPVRIVGSIRDITEKGQRDREMGAVAAISLALREIETTEEMLPIISEQIGGTLGIKSVGLALVNSESDAVVVKHVTGAFKKCLGLQFAKNQGFIGGVFGEAERKFCAGLDEALAAKVPLGSEYPAACLGVPLVARGDVIGVLWLGKTAESGKKEVAFSPSEYQLLEILAEIAAASIRRAALRDRTEFHLRRLHSLSIIHATVSENMNLRTTLDMLLEQLRAQTKVDAAAFHLYDEAQTCFRLATSVGFGNGAVVPSLGRELIVNRRRSKLMDLFESGSRGRRFGTLIAAGFESCLATPLVANENVVGVLEIFHRSELPPDIDVDNFVEMLASQAAIAVDNATLLKSLRTANRELTAAYDATIEGWSRALDLRDHETEGHSRRVTDMTVELAKLMDVPPAQIADMRRGALLHDIGKMAIPDSVLHKPGELDQNELVIMRRHPGIALDLLEPVVFLKSAIDIPFCHHERWDGSGYPRGLKEYQIPLAARIFAVVDVWDALRSDRPYRKRWPRDQAVQFISVQANRQFDPEIVSVFLNNLEKFEPWN